MRPNKKYTNENTLFDRNLCYPNDHYGGEYVELEGTVEDFEKVSDTLWGFDIKTTCGLFRGYWDHRLEIDITPGKSSARIRVYSWGGGWYPDNKITSLCKQRD